jgi:hypothetical protein
MVSVANPMDWGLIPKVPNYKTNKKLQNCGSTVAITHCNLEEKTIPALKQRGIPGQSP